MVVGVTAPNQDIDDGIGNIHIDLLAIYHFVHSCRPVVKPLRGTRYEPPAIGSNALRVFAGALTRPQYIGQRGFPVHSSYVLKSSPVYSRVLLHFGLVHRSISLSSGFTGWIPLSAGGTKVSFRSMFSPQVLQTTYQRSSATARNTLSHLRMIEPIVGFDESSWPLVYRYPWMFTFE